MTDYSLDTLYLGVPSGYLSVVGLPSAKTEFFALSQLDEAREYMERRANSENTYFGWGVLGTKPARGRGSEKDVIALPGVNFDWDIKSSDPRVHAKNDVLPENLDVVLQLLKDAGLPAPTSIVDSGNGFYGRYHFDKPWHFPSDEERLKAKAFLHDLHVRFAKAFSDAGFHMDNVNGMASLTRMPGTFNHKTNPPKQVTLHSYDPEQLYTVEALASLIEAKAAPVAKRQPNRKKSRVTASEDPAESKKPNFDAVKAGCAWVDHCVENASHLPEPEWAALASIVERCADGRELFHELSSEDPRYDSAETDGKLGRFKGPRTCVRICEDFGFAGCKECAFYGGEAVKSPLQLGTIKPAVAELMAKNVFVIKTSQYVEIATGVSRTDKQFSDKHRSKTGQHPHTVLNINLFTRKVDEIDYLPGLYERIVAQDKGLTAFNLWLPAPIVPVEGDFGVIKDHFSFIIPDEVELTHYLDAMAHAVQHPGIKIRHVLMITGGQGTGKSFIGNLLKTMFGEANCHTVAGEQILSPWNATMGNIQALIWEESGVGNRLEAAEMMKPWISEEQITVNQKHLPMYQARTPRTIWGFTNQQRAISISGDDRRYFLINSPAIKQETGYYERLWADGMKQVPAFLHSLLHRDISRFNPSAPPPMTEAKRCLIADSRPAVVKEIESMIAEGEYPFISDLVRRDDVLKALIGRVSIRANLTAHAVQEAMRELGFVSLQDQVRIKGMGRTRLWAWQNTGKWSTASDDDIRAEFRKRLLSDWIAAE